MNHVFQKIIMIGIFVVCIRIYSEDIWQWRGSSRNGVYNETNLLKKWDKNGPKLIWYYDGVKNGYSSPVIVKGKVYVTGEEDGVEYLTAITLTGKKIWQVQYGNASDSRFPSARTTPTIVDGKAYLVTGIGEVVCIDAITGKKIWYVNGHKKFQGKEGRFGTAESPLVFDNKVIFTPGGNKTTIVALDRKDGSVIWQSVSLYDARAYVSPLLINHNGNIQIVAVTGKYIFGVGVEKGNIIWKINYKTAAYKSRRWQNNTNTPLYYNGYIFVTSGYDHGSVLLKLNKDATSAEVQWRSADLDVHHGGVVLVNGYLYGANWLNNKKGNWVCLDWKNGKKQYETRWGGKGSIISADGMLYCYEELRGNLALVEATPKSFKIVSSFRIRKGSGQHWCHPVISNKRLYLRRGNRIMVYDIAAHKGK